jgi:phosphoribosyl 1,2-cyclic phosphate phosphodiesterase
MAKQEIIFLGSSGAITIPAFFCECATCEAARKDPTQHRTRASLALIGEEITIIDPGPDLEFQLEREAIRRMDNIFITHWHYDHVWGLASLGEPAGIQGWPKIHVYGTQDVVTHFDQELWYMKEKVNPHTITVGDRIDLPDATWEVVKTTHTEHSIGFICEGNKKYAYLVDGIVPPSETIERLDGVELLIMESTLDSLDVDTWQSFNLKDALEFWKSTNIPECILTHLSCHGWMDGKLVAGLTPEERKEYENDNPGLIFAYDGLRVEL